MVRKLNTKCAVYLQHERNNEMTGIEVWNIISPIIYQNFVAVQNEYKDEGMDIYLKTYFALKDLDEKENEK